MIDILEDFPETSPWDQTLVEAGVRDAFFTRTNFYTEMTEAGWNLVPAAKDGPNGGIYTTTPSDLLVGYYMIKICGRVGRWGAMWPELTEVGPSEYGWSADDGFYWYERIIKPWEYYDATLADAVELLGAPPTAEPLSTKAARGVTPQLGLLEDDILYNLALLATNILEPLRHVYPNIIVASGFRQVNNGISQHEKGEAVDLQIRNQTPTLLYEVADYISKRLPFDQLILNYVPSPALSWIHVSFSAQMLRYEVLTRDFDDTFHAGLYLVDALTGEDRAAALREQADYLRLIDEELSVMTSRSAKLAPATIIGDEPPADGAGGSGDDGEPGQVPNEAGTVRDVYNSQEWELSSVDAPNGCGVFVEVVASRLGGNWGMLKKSGGQNQYNGHAVDALAYKGLQANGKMVTAVDIVVGAGDENASVGWGVDTPRYDESDWYSI
tara:strand:+ start:1291 stop:2610 length:1320 start_codon:yes stop_codon:yes gene_type:complete